MISRRSFLKASATAVVAVPVVGACYGFAESSTIEIERRSVAVRNLPSNFQGLRVAFLTDIHHGPYLPLEMVASIVRTTQMLQPELILLGGDYCLRDGKYIPPCFEVLAGLSAPMGVFGVMGNHDYSHGEAETKQGLKRAGIEELTNRGEWLTRGSQRLRLAGIDDLWRGRPKLEPAIGDATMNDAVVLLSHNPDFAETMTDRRVGLVLSGHTHGGQVSVPGMRNPFIPSRYGMKYAKGLVESPTSTVYVSKGLGVTSIPMRYNCPPELTLLTLH